MRLAVKTLDGDTFYVEVDPEAQISTIRKTIASTREGFPEARQKLIYMGKILDDARTLDSYSVKENSFIVCMLLQERMDAAADADDFEDEPGDSEGLEEAPAPQQIEINPETIQMLTTITGASEQQAIDALRVALGDADVAASILMSGGVPHSHTTQSPPLVQGGAGSPAGASSPQPGGDQHTGLDLMQMDLIPPEFQQGGPGGAAGGADAPAPDHAAPTANPLEALRNHPQFLQMRILVQSNPSMLQQVIREMGAQNPQILQMIQENPQAFLQLLNEPVGDQAGQQQQQQQHHHHHHHQQQQQQPEEPHNPAPPAPHAPATSPSLDLSPEEQASISRLEQLGFPRTAALEAYLACEKNEEMAANFLFESM